MKLLAEKRHPRYLINRKRVCSNDNERKKDNEEYIENDNTGKQVPTFSGGAWLHHLKGRRHHGGFRGGTTGTLHRDGCGVRGDTQLLDKGYQGAAGLQRRLQTGLVHQGTLQTGASEGRHELPLSRSFERHFNERPYLKHTCYLYLTKTTKERNRDAKQFQHAVPGISSRRSWTGKRRPAFLEACEQFERIMNDSALIRLRRLSTDEIVGTRESPGLMEKYFSLMPEGDTTVCRTSAASGRMRIGDKRLCLHTLSDAEDLPGKVSTDIRYERISTDRSDCRLSFAAPVGLLLSCNHIY